MVELKTGFGADTVPALAVPNAESAKAGFLVVSTNPTSKEPMRTNNDSKACGWVCGGLTVPLGN